MAINLLPGRFASITMIAKTMLASPRGPNQPRNSLDEVLSPVPVSERKIGSIRTNVRLISA